jgi:hypothetical protein
MRGFKRFESLLILLFTMPATAQPRLLPVPYPPRLGPSGGGASLSPPPTSIPAIPEAYSPNLPSMPIPAPPPPRMQVSCGAGTSGVAIAGGYACLSRPISQAPTFIPVRQSPSCSYYAGARTVFLAGGYVCMPRR